MRRIPTIGYLGAYADGDAPLVPSLFRRGKQLHATDGSNVYGPFDNEEVARITLTLALVKRRRDRFEWTFLFACAGGICLLCLLLAL